MVFAVVTLLPWRRMVKQRAMWRWRGGDQNTGARTTQQGFPQMPRPHGLPIARLILVAAMLGATTGHAIRENEGPKTMVAGTAFRAITFSVGEAELLAPGLRRHARLEIAKALRQRLATGAGTKHLD